MTLYELEVILPPERTGEVIEIDLPNPPQGEIELRGGIVALRPQVLQEPLKEPLKLLHPTPQLPHLPVPRLHHLPHHLH